MQTGEITQVKVGRKYGMPCRVLARKCKNKIENMAEKRPGSLPVLWEAAEKDLVQCTLEMQKQDLPVGWKMIIQKTSEIHHYMFVSVCSLGSVGWGWCDKFMSWHGKLTLRTAPIIKGARNEANHGETAKLLLWAMSAHNWAGDQKITVVEYGWD